MIQDELQNSSFIKTLLNEIPCGVLVLDADLRIRQINNVIEKIIGVKNDEAVGKCGGDILNCINAIRSPNGCGSTVYCNTCVTRRAAADALQLNRKNQAQGNFQLVFDGKSRNVKLHISASPFSFLGKRYAIVIINNISQLEEVCQPENRLFSQRIIGEHQSVKELYGLIYEASRVDLPVLIQGASGTGKELVARAIHDAGPRNSMPFIAVNCGALPHTLLESELFGHEKGAFTGALYTKKGRFELADGGTIFLDEIGELDLSVQVKLLRVLQEGTFERIGGTSTIKVDARLLSATNKKLEDEITTGLFRLDLYYRLCVVPINISNLRERGDDVILLANHFLAESANNRGETRKTLCPQSVSLLKLHTWPGNIRELQNTIQFALMKCKTDIIEPHHFPQYLQGYANPAADTLAGIMTPREATPKLDMAAVRAALEKTGGNKSEAAKMLGVGRATLYRFFSKKLAG
ncbi:MAG: sigma 54-interacting transcriptional regulator [Deltaproteobacteria bacterium]|nr:sigma 54-interacting transcriptional regulator [Deltaproteobacteria bacterium]